MAEKKDARLIVSMTSYPERISYVPAVLECMKKQTLRPDEVMLYLSRENFPKQEADLPSVFRGLIQDGDVTVRWVDGDLKPHKKYFYAFQEFRKDYVVTVDDDATYAPTLLETLWKTHERFPDAVIAGRTHLMTLDAEGKIRPYNEWIHRTMGFGNAPSMQLMAVGVGGVLYDPEMFPDALLDISSIETTCLEADDLWLKSMEAAAGIPVVRAPISDIVPSVPGSQATALYKKNRNQGENDRILTEIARLMEETYGKEFLVRSILESSFPVVRGEDALLSYVNSDKGRFCNAVEEQGGNDEAARQTIVELRAEVERITGLREHERAQNLTKNQEIERLREQLAKQKADQQAETDRLKTWIEKQRADQQAEKVKVNERIEKLKADKKAETDRLMGWIEKQKADQQAEKVKVNERIEKIKAAQQEEKERLMAWIEKLKNEQQAETDRLKGMMADQKAELSKEIDRQAELREHERQQNIVKNEEIDRLRTRMSEQKAENIAERERMKAEHTEKMQALRERMKTEHTTKVNELRADFERQRDKIRQENAMLHYCLDHPILSRLDKTKKTLFPKTHGKKSGKKDTGSKETK